MIAVGSRTKLALARETTFGTAPGGAYSLVPFVSDGLGLRQELLENDILGLGRDAQRPQRDVKAVDGRVTVPVDQRAIGYWLQGLLGDPTSTDNGDGTWTHTFQSGGDTLPSFTLEKQFEGVNVYHTATGVMVNGLSLGVEPTGRAQAEVDVLAADMTITASSAAGSTSAVSITRFHQFAGTIKKDGADLAKITGISVDLRNNLDPVRYVGGGGAIGDIVPGIIAVTGQLDARFADTSLFDLAENETVFDLEFGWQADATHYLLFKLEQAELTAAGAPVDGPGGVAARFQLAGSVDTAVGRSLTVTLRNDLASY
ncbi:MAG TPA: hypothetical protein ENJ38_00115 [Rhodospirillales bacterium]|nr:hypothetical protein [Rhodospirillales bacterium]